MNMPDKRISFLKMTRFPCFLLFVVTIVLRLSNSASLNRYKAAVVEYRPLWDSKYSPSENILLNALKYSEIIGVAAKYETDIIVFPANGLTGYNLSGDTLTPKQVNAEDNTQDEVLQIISDAALKNLMYVVINFVENINMSIYTTNFIFDRSGTIISRYRKFNTNRDNADIVTFDTDFGVKFGTFVDLDILESLPMEMVRQGIRDFVYPTAWFNEFPFLSAIQAQWSWSYGNDVNLLAANLNDIERGSCGSGLHRGRKFKSLSKQTIFKGSFMIIGNIPIGSDEALTDDDVIVYLEVPKEGTFVAKKDNINIYKTQLLNISSSKEAIFENGTQVGYKARTNHKTKICKKDFCCFFEVNSTSYFLQEPTPNNKTNFNFRYRFLIFNDKRNFLNVHFGLQLCAIAPCINESKSSCFNFPHENEHFQIIIEDKIYYLNSTVFDNINITATFYEEAVILPNILESSQNFGTVPDPDKFVFTSSEKIDGIEASLVFNSKNLISIGLWGRIFGDKSTTYITYYLMGGSFLMFCIFISMVCSCRRYKPKRVLKSAKNPTFRLQVSFGDNSRSNE